MTRVLITGGAGFIGSNLANRLLNEGFDVTIFDNLSRIGCDANLTWLRETHGPCSFRVIIANLTDFDALKRATKGVEHVYHLAGQVSVITSIENPRRDFEDNLLGTFNTLEAARLFGNDPIFIYSSTNKVYGALEGIEVLEDDTRYQYSNLPFGVPETQPLDFYSPYACSKGAGDQYTRDYARIYGMRTVVLRQSCIYGYRQFGVEAQGWIAWFIIAALKRCLITIYGNGKQVRDILFIDDLLDAYDTIVRNITTTVGQVYNIGGGFDNTISIWAEFGPLLESLVGYSVPVHYAEQRLGDQKVYISDISKAEHKLGWGPQVSSQEGIVRLFKWIYDHQDLFE